MKKTVCLLLLAVLLLAAAVLAPALKTEALSVTNEKLYVAPDPDAGLYGRLSLIFDGDGSSYTLYLPGGADAEKLCFSWHSSVKVKGADGKVLTSGSAPIALPGSTVEYKVNSTVYRITTVQGSKDVRAMFLQTDASIPGYSSFTAMNSDKTKETSAAGTLTLGSGNDYYFSIKGRGNATWSRAKNPYNITLYADAACTDKKGFELIEGVKAKKWSLLANYFDDSLLRNRLGFDLAVRLGIGLECEFVDLYADGEYLGLYLLTPKSDYDAPKNGYMLEIDNYIDTEDHQFTLDGMNELNPTGTGTQNRISVKDNKANASYEDIEAYMQAAWKALLDEESDDYLNYIDLDSWAKYYLLQEFCKNFDVVSGSIFMCREGTTDDDKLIAGPVWDLDNSMGRVQNNSDSGLSVKAQHSPSGWYIQRVHSDKIPDFWLQQLGKHESFMARVEELYVQHQSVFDSAAASVDGWIEQIGDSARMNFHLPKNGSGRPAITDPLTYSCGFHGCVITEGWEDFAYNLRNFADKRAAFLREEWGDETAVPETTTPSTEPTEEPTAPAPSVSPTNPSEAPEPQTPERSLRLWYFLLPAAAAVILLILFLRKRKQ